MARPISPHEVALYARFCDGIVAADRGKFLDQIFAAEIVDEDVGHASFAVVSSESAISAPEFAFTLDAFYRDNDGDLVSVILHFILPGIVSWVERFRIDGKPVEKLLPRPSEVVLSIGNVR